MPRQLKAADTQSELIALNEMPTVKQNKFAKMSQQYLL